MIIIIMMKMIDDEFGTDFLFLNNDLSSSETHEIKQTLLNDRFFFYCYSRGDDDCLKKDSVIILYGHASQEFDLLGWC